MKKLKLIYLLMIVLVISGWLAPPSCAAATSSPDVQILMDGSTQPSQTSNPSIAVQLDIVFNNLRWYNDSLCLSYHIYDGEDNLLLYEGRRYPIKNGESGEIHSFPVSLNLQDWPETKDPKNIMVCFDIVDEKNGFWFQDSPDLQLEAAAVLYDGHFLSRVRETLVGAISRPITLFINLMGCVALILGLIAYRNYTKKVVLTGPFWEDGASHLDRFLYEHYFTGRKRRGVVTCMGATGQELENILPYISFFVDVLKWEKKEEYASSTEKSQLQKTDLLIIAGEHDVLPFLYRLEVENVFPAVICFDFHGTDYETLLGWVTANHYRYDARSFNYVFLKKENFVERFIY